MTIYKLHVKMFCKIMFDCVHSKKGGFAYQLVKLWLFCKRKVGSVYEMIVNMDSKVYLGVQCHRS